MKKALIITYYWPPAGGGGVQRVAKFCKYLPALGWEPIVLTVENGNFPTSDQSLLSEVAAIRKVYHAPSQEPHVIYDSLTRLMRRRPESKGTTESTRASGESSCLRRLGELIRLNLFVPDSRIGWRRNARRKGLEIIAQEKPDLILSSSPPYTPHLIAADLKKASGLPWVIDFRDPWLENHAYNTAPRLGFIKQWNRRLETGVLRQADHVLAANPGIRDFAMMKLDASEHGKFQVITNGYDIEDVRPTVRPLPRFTVSYYGTVYPQGFPMELFEGMRELIDADPAFADDFHFRIIGSISPNVRASVEQTLPAANLTVSDYIPHSEMIDQLYEAQGLVVVLNDFVNNHVYAPGKIYEYLPSGNPILGIGPTNGDAAALLAQTQAGVMLDYGDKDGVKQFLLNQYARWRAGTLSKGPVSYPLFERRTLTQELAKVFNRLTA
ncbi:MAG: glycosyltransferase [Kiritimatiellia bacterium]|jgi:glycosyltransferase involved in cell wall biosynthesis|nr:glycosyltransferase [Kiritimatiellia bacterium]